MFQIRLGFVEFICTGLVKKNLSSMTSCILLLAAHDPELEVRQRAKIHFQRMKETMLANDGYNDYVLLIS